jgi:hypothetical protein
MTVRRTWREHAALERARCERTLREHAWRRHAQRGQTLVETALFLPLLLLALFGIIYFSQYGVLQERSLTGARFASLISNGGTTTGFTLESLYHELHREGTDQTDPGFPAASKSCAANAATDGQNALTQSETMPGGGVGPTAPPYFQPDAGSAAQTGCGAQSISLSSTATDNANWYFMAQFTHVEADKTAPGWIRTFLPNVQTGHVKGGMLNLRAASPDNIIYCSPGFAMAIANGLGAVEPKPLAGPFANYATPPPTQPHSC